MKRARLEARFEAELQGGHKQAAVEVPFDPQERWHIAPVHVRRGRNGHRVRGTVNGVEFESVVVPRMRRFWLELSDELQRAGKLSIGDVATFVIAPVAASEP
jgi:hypothetical protein